MDIDMPLADIAKKLKKDNKKNKNKKGPKPGKNAAKNKQVKGNTPKKGTPNKVKGGVGKVMLVIPRHTRCLLTFWIATVPSRQKEP